MKNSVERIADREKNSLSFSNLIHQYTNIPIYQYTNDPMTNDLLDRKGFTLLEVLIALVIIGGALITVIHSLSYHISQIERHETVTKAVLYGERALRYDTLWKTDKADSGKGDNIRYFPGSSHDEDFREYSLSIKTIETGLPGLMLREVRVSKGPEEIILRRLIRQ